MNQLSHGATAPVTQSSVVAVDTSVAPCESLDTVEVRMGYDAWTLGCNIANLRDDVRGCESLPTLQEAIACADAAMVDIEKLKREAESKLAAQSFVGTMVAA